MIHCTFNALKHYIKVYDGCWTYFEEYSSCEHNYTIQMELFNIYFVKFGPVLPVSGLKLLATCK